MFNMLLLAGLAVTVVAYLLPSVRSTALSIVGIPATTGSTRVVSAVNAVLIVLIAGNLFGTILGLVVGLGTVAFANRGYFTKTRS